MEFPDRLAVHVDRLAAYVRAQHRRFPQILLGIAIAAALLAGAAIWVTIDVFRGLPDSQAVRTIDNFSQATTLFDANNRPAFTIFKEQRIEVPLSRISPLVVRAILAIEDQRFYDHSGVDVVRIAGAALHNIVERRAAQGASTITQQLARQSLLTTEKTFRRKLKEAVVARRIEREFSKDEILEAYLNKMYFGDGLYGVEAAALGFFGKHASDVNLPEAALLAGLLKSPSTYAPTISRARATARRTVVLQAMRDMGAITAAEQASAAAAPLALNDAMRGDDAYGQYFREEVRQQLVEQFGWERVYQGGLKVYTTIDLGMQKAAEAEVMRSLDELEKRRAKASRPRKGVVAPPAAPLQAALVALDPRTGEVRAMVGGRNFLESRFNRAVQAKRQPGSAFKPFVYAAAIERGYTAATMITGLNDPTDTPQGAWTPEEGHVTGDSIIVRDALRTSSNRAAVRMLEAVGIPETVSYAERLGIDSVPSVPSLALGSGEVTVLSMTAAFGAFGNRGVLMTPSLIRRVEDTNGEVLFNGGSTPQRAMSEATAFIITSMLSDALNSGTGWQVRRVGFTLPAAGKTGTTNDYHDAWFVGYTPSLATGVWVGLDQPDTILRGGYAGDVAAPLWGRFMKAATSNSQPERFSAPSTVTGVEICRRSGKLPVEGCRHALDVDKDGRLVQRSMIMMEYFVRGTEPLDFCPLHSTPHSTTLVAGIPGQGTVLTQGEEQAPPEPLPTAGIAAATPPDAATTTEPPPARKRGFWARIFGRGGGEPKKPASTK